ncbi:podocin [Spea bombifrons]|uniref:podocin n=1 Tax=Spea bombifrons TaxID=233779 RepID=UPI00234A5ED9|nr:podocin [Spea bombifrons]
MTEKRSRSSSREPPQRQRDSSTQGSKRERRGSPGSGRSKRGRSKEPDKNDTKVSTVVDVDDVVVSDEETEIMALLESGQKDDGVKPAGLRICEMLLVFCCLLLVIVTFPLSIWLCVKIVREYERVVIFRLGRLLPGRARGPGLFFYLPCLDKCHKLDFRLKTFEVPFHQIVTKDLVTLEVDAVCYYRLENASLFLTSVSSVSSALQLLIQTTMKRLLAHKAFLDVLLERKSIGEEVKVALDAVTCHWGIKIERTEIKNVKVPDEVKQSMAIEEEAKVHAKVKVIAAENEKSVSEALRLAAESLSGSPTAIQLRYLHALQCMTSERPATFFLPLPFDLMNGNSTPKVSDSSVTSNAPKSEAEAEQGKKKDSPML